MERIQNLSQRILPNLCSSKATQQYLSKSKNKLEWFQDQGWGFKDTEFIVGSDGVVHLTGKRYQFSGEQLPKFREWAEQTVGINLDIKTPQQNEVPVNPSIINQEFLDSIQGKVEQINMEGKVRILHSHGHTLQEIFALRHGKFERTADAVVFISSHVQAQTLVAMANKHNVVLIPYGGGTNVTQALMCPKDQKRMIISVDMTRMNHVQWVDRKNMTALVEVGIIGKDLELELSRYGVTCGHEPDSVQFSSLGGWISTRASGMKKNQYGNIEDIILNFQLVTALGTITKSQDSPRTSSGPDITEFILGSEGTMGIITQAIIKVRPLPPKVVFDSIIFHNFQEGQKFMYDVAMAKMWPASIRLMDNNQFVFGMSLKTEVKSKTHELMDKAKKFVVTEILKYEPEKMCLCTIVYEGTSEEVHLQQSKVNSLAKKFKGFRAGPENGERGYFLTFVIAYIRDFAFEYGYVAESFETSCQWKDVSRLCKNTSQRIEDECQQHGVQKAPFISFRVTQVYDTGAAVYVYFGFVYYGIKNPVEAYEEIQDAAREEVMKNGGNISHHHGVGKLRKQFMKNSVGQGGIEMIRAVKQKLDPNNVFANGNLV